MADQGNEGLLSPFLRRRRIGAAKKHIRGRVLDVGCGSGSLADLVNPENYVGMDVDDVSLQVARSQFPGHTFVSELPAEQATFDTIVSLAVIEHVPSPADFLSDLATRLKAHADARIIITTPHPKADWIHDLGSSIGLFSQHANEEHEELLGRKELREVADKAGLRLVSYRRFLFGVNQLAIYQRP